MKPFEIDELYPSEVWIMIHAYDENLQIRWEMTRAICFNTAKFGQSDPKNFPKTPQRFWPFPWDEGEARIDSKTILEQHARRVALRKQFENQI